MFSGNVFYRGDKAAAEEVLHEAEQLANSVSIMKESLGVANFRKQLQTNNGTQVDIVLNEHHSFLTIYAVGEEYEEEEFKEEEIEEGAGAVFRFDPWESNCPLAIVTRNSDGVWEVEITPRYGGERVNGISDKQYVSFDTSQIAGDYFSLDSVLGHKVYKDGTSILTVSQDDHIVGATIYEHYFVAFVLYGSSHKLQVLYTPAIASVVPQDEVDIEWTEGMFVDLSGVTSTAVAPMMFNLGSNIGHFAYIEATTHVIHVNEATLSLEGEDEDEEVIFALSIKSSHSGLTAHSSANTPQASNPVTTGSFSFSYGETWAYGRWAHGPPFLPGPWNYSDCMTPAAASAWAYAEVSQHESSWAVNTFDDCNGDGVVVVWQGQDSSPPIDCVGQVIGFNNGYKMEQYSGDTVDPNAFSVSTIKEQTLTPPASIGGLVNGAYQVGTYSINDSRSEVGYVYSAIKAGLRIRNCAAHILVADERTGFIEELLKNNRHITVGYAGGTLADTRDTTLEGYKDDYVVLYNNTESETQKQSVVTYYKSHFDSTYVDPYQSVCNLYYFNETNHACTSPTDSPQCDNYLHSIIGERTWGEKVRYVPLAQPNTYLEYSYDATLVAIADASYHVGNIIEQVPQDVIVTYRMKLLIEDVEYTLPGFSELDILYEDMEVDLVTRASYAPPASNYYEVPTREYNVSNEWYAMISNASDHMLISMLSVFPIETFGDYDGEMRNAHRLVYDAELKTIINLVPLYNEAIIQYNIDNKTTHDEMGAQLEAHQGVIPLKLMGVI